MLECHSFIKVKHKLYSLFSQRTVINHLNFWIDNQHNIWIFARFFTSIRSINSIRSLCFHVLSNFFQKSEKYLCISNKISRPEKRSNVDYTNNETDCKQHPCCEKTQSRN